MINRATEPKHKSVSQLVLASSSPRRKELVALLDLSLPVSVFSIEVDETIDSAWQAAEAVEQLGLAKAEAVAKAIATDAAPDLIEPGGALILAADTVVVVDGEIVGKPSCSEEAVQTLNRIQGRSHYVYTGVVLRYVSNGTDGKRAIDTAFGQFGQYRLLLDEGGQAAAAVGHSYSQVTFRPMSDKEIKDYVMTGEPLDKAGSYGIQGIGSVFIEKIEGDFYSVMGLPLNLLYHMMLNFGVSPFINKS